ncbi:hypothetical protein [Flavobacterium sp. 140616W15]|uniref:hypothetical protein n=1 Tax=Flavobacterium sp. 140616W15 TaxID=2478552 RepID=UPI000F0C7168|nr:hypothetical protein [Flavobacterium sp. 140616W15]AYN05478.1 hypothetical protein EAG11_15970 [Flavobacterium sp. 140616W15]
MFLKKKNNDYFKILTFITIVGLTLVSCKNEPSNLPKRTTDDNVKKSKKTKSKNEKVIDSIKMHAFDNLYFGTHDEIKSNEEYSINDLDYTIKTYQSLPVKGLCYFMLVSKYEITTQEKVKRELNDLRTIISKKYGNPVNINRTFHIQHPEEMGKGESFFDTRASYKYDKKIIGLPYEFVACTWNLRYKEIQIGYFIEHKNRTAVFQSSLKSNNYTIYIEIRSKLIMPEKTNSVKKDNAKDINKF